MKLYKYRPLSDSLFKELFYQEIFFASYPELNDPFDLKARIDFSPKNEKQLTYLIWFLFKTSLNLNFNNLSEKEIALNKSAMAFNKDKEGQNHLRKKIFEQLKSIKRNQSIITIEHLEDILYRTTQDFYFKPNIKNFKKEINRLTDKFLANSYTTCFSERNDEFLMWSHYASKHSGICLEFSLPEHGLFTYKMTGKRIPNNEEYQKIMSDWTITEHLYANRLNKVTYHDEQPSINFFDFSYAFDNEYDSDLIGLSKSWAHEYAYKLEKVFSTKTNHWKYENEWRDIEINFGESKFPEDRINHYPIESLSAIYFGCNTPENSKVRIFKIFEKLSPKMRYYTCELSSGKSIEFSDWEYFES